MISAVLVVKSAELKEIRVKCSILIFPFYASSQRVIKEQKQFAITNYFHTEQLKTDKNNQIQLKNSLAKIMHIFDDLS